jgi:tetratricopeptide (TPR) repeat protein
VTILDARGVQPTGEAARFAAEGFTVSVFNDGDTLDMATLSLTPAPFKVTTRGKEYYDHTPIDGGGIAVPNPMLEEALGIDPKSAMFHLNLGNLQDQAGRKDDALKSYLKALELEPKNVNAHYNLGLLYVEMGKLNDAKQALSEALQLAPDDAETKKQLDLVTKKLGGTPP